jgi:hypothetical protein
VNPRLLILCRLHITTHTQIHNLTKITEETAWANHIMKYRIVTIYKFLVWGGMLLKWHVFESLTYLFFMYYGITAPVEC